MFVKHLESPFLDGVEVDAVEVTDLMHFVDIIKPGLGAIEPREPVIFAHGEQGAQVKVEIGIGVIRPADEQAGIAVADGRVLSVYDEVKAADTENIGGFVHDYTSLKCAGGRCSPDQVG